MTPLERQWSEIARDVIARRAEMRRRAAGRASGGDAELQHDAARHLDRGADAFAQDLAAADALPIASGIAAE